MRDDRRPYVRRQAARRFQFRAVLLEGRRAIRLLHAVHVEGHIDRAFDGRSAFLLSDIFWVSRVDDERVFESLQHFLLGILNAFNHRRRARMIADCRCYAKQEIMRERKAFATSQENTLNLLSWSPGNSIENY